MTTLASAPSQIAESAVAVGPAQDQQSTDHRTTDAECAQRQPQQEQEQQPQPQPQQEQEQPPQPQPQQEQEQQQQQQPQQGDERRGEKSESGDAEPEIDYDKYEAQLRGVAAPRTDIAPIVPIEVDEAIAEDDRHAAALFFNVAEEYFRTYSLVSMEAAKNYLRSAIEMGSRHGGRGALVMCFNGVEFLRAQPRSGQQVMLPCNHRDYMLLDGLRKAFGEFKQGIEHVKTYHTDTQFVVWMLCGTIAKVKRAVQTGQTHGVIHSFVVGQSALLPHDDTLLFETRLSLMDRALTHWRSARIEAVQKSPTLRKCFNCGNHCDVEPGFQGNDSVRRGVRCDGCRFTVYCSEMCKAKALNRTPSHRVLCCSWSTRLKEIFTERERIAKVTFEAGKKRHEEAVAKRKKLVDEALAKRQQE